MADSKRGGRSDDDEFDENEVLDELDGDDADFEADDDDDAEPAGRKDRAGAGAVARSSSARTANRDKKRDETRLGLVGRLVKFIREVVAELSKVIYPTRKELLTYTAVVLVFVVVVMTVVASLDVGFAQLMFLIFGSQTTT